MLFIFALPVFAGVSLPNPLCPNWDGTGSCPANCVCTLSGLINNIATYITNIIGILATLMFLIAGILFVISAGNPGRVETAKKAAIYAAIGAAIALAGKGLIEVIKAVIG